MELTDRERRVVYDCLVRLADRAELDLLDEFEGWDDRDITALMRALHKFERALPSASES